MGRYEFIRAYFGVLRFLAQCYYSLVNAAFALLNAFKPVEHVQWTNASSLLFIPALKAAEMIRQRQVKIHDFNRKIQIFEIWPKTVKKSNF